jgi:hypothetical protein
MRCCEAVSGTSGGFATEIVYSDPNCSILLLGRSSRLHCLTVRLHYRLSGAAHYNYVAA